MEGMPSSGPAPVGHAHTDPAKHQDQPAQRPDDDARPASRWGRAAGAGETRHQDAAQLAPGVAISCQSRCQRVTELAATSPCATASSRMRPRSGARACLGAARRD